MNMVKLIKKAFWKFPLDIKIVCYLDVKVHFSSLWKEKESWIQVNTHTDSTTLKEQMKEETLKMESIENEEWKKHATHRGI